LEIIREKKISRIQKYENYFCDFSFLFVFLANIVHTLNHPSSNDMLRILHTLRMWCMSLSFYTQIAQLPDHPVYSAKMKKFALILSNLGLRLWTTFLWNKSSAVSGLFYHILTNVFHYKSICPKQFGICIGCDDNYNCSTDSGPLISNCNLSNFGFDNIDDIFFSKTLGSFCITLPLVIAKSSTHIFYAATQAFSWNGMEKLFPEESVQIQIQNFETSWFLHPNEFEELWSQFKSKTKQVHKVSMEEDIETIMQRF